MSWALDDQPAPVRETLKAPPKRWRNWWRAPFSGELMDGRAVRVGDCLPGPWHPSRDVARTRAAKYLAEARARGGICMDYVDAYPEGERP